MCIALSSKKAACPHAYRTPSPQLDPDNHKTIVEIQEEAARVKLNGAVKRKGKDSASSGEEEDDDKDSGA